MIFLLMINGFMMKYVDFVADVVQPYSQIVILRPEGAAASLHISDEPTIFPFRSKAFVFCLFANSVWQKCKNTFQKA